MTKQEFNKTLKELNLTKKEFCEKLRIKSITLENNWGIKYPIPYYAISWLEIYKTAQKYEQFIEILKNHHDLNNIIKEKPKETSQFFKRKDFDLKLKALNLTRREFCQKVGIAYSTPNSWDKYSPIPLWVEAWLNTYENAENFKKLEIFFQNIFKNQKPIFAE